MKELAQKNFTLKYKKVTLKINTYYKKKIIVKIKENMQSTQERL